MEPGLVLHTPFSLYAFDTVTMRLQLNTKRLHFRKRYLANIYLTHTCRDGKIFGLAFFSFFRYYVSGKFTPKA